MPWYPPGPIAEYFAAEQARDALALARCFVDDGVVHDEGGTFRGRTGDSRLECRRSGEVSPHGDNGKKEPDRRVQKLDLCERGHQRLLYVMSTRLNSPYVNSPSGSSHRASPNDISRTGPKSR